MPKPFQLRRFKMKELIREYPSYNEVGLTALYFNNEEFFGTIEVSAGKECGQPYYFRLGYSLATFDFEIEQFFAQNPQYIAEAKAYFGGKIILGESEVYYF